MLLTIFKITDMSTSDYEAIRFECFVGKNPMLATMYFQRVLFDSDVAFKSFRGKLRELAGDADEWEADDNFSDAFSIEDDGLVAQKIKLPKKFYRYEKDKKGKFVKSTPERIVSFAKFVCFPDENPQVQIDRYLANVPDNCWIEEDEEEDKESE